MTEQIPAIIAAPLFVILSLTAFYRCVILPAFKKDGDANPENLNANENHPHSRIR